MGDNLRTINKWSVTCPSNTSLADIKAAVDNSKDKIEYAETVGEFIKVNNTSIDKLRKAKKTLDDFSGVLGKADDICRDIKAVDDIHTVTKILNQPGFIRMHPETAAKGFEILFRSFATFSRHLPPPLNIYTPILEGLGNGFFTNVSKALNPQLRTINGLDILKKERQTIANPVRSK